MSDRMAVQPDVWRQVVAEMPGLRTELVDVEAALAHTIKPSHTAGIISSRGLDDTSLRDRVGPVLDRPLFHYYYLDVDAFGGAVAAALDSQVSGYAIELRRAGTTVWSRANQLGRLGNDPTAPAAALPWSAHVRMHVASCSKLITAMAMTKLLAVKGISADSPIAPYLPNYWAQGPNVGSVTFAHLLTHRSGFVTQPKSDSDFGFMKAKVAAGVTATGGYSYANMNFGLCRILIATMNGDIDPGARFQVLALDLSDHFWDTITVEAYSAYVANNVFAPANVNGPVLDHPASMALAYQRPAAVPGWDSGDLRSMSGGAAWHMSVRDLLDVMGTFRRSGQIVSPGAAQAMLDRRFGIDEIIDTVAGRLYDKNGYWMDGAGHAEQACVYFLPEDMELAVLANSPYGNGNIPNLRDAITMAYEACLREQMQFPGPVGLPAFVYAVAGDGDLLWYRHDGADAGGGLNTWQGANSVGTGWGDLEHVFSGGGDVIYAIDSAGTLKWFEHRGFNSGDGLDRPDSWAGPRDVGVGWQGFEHVFSGGAGVIYVIDANGTLRWYRHHAVADGGGLDVPGAWSGPADVGVGWSDLKFVFSTGEGVIYAVHTDGTLRWFRHNRWADGHGLETPGAWDGGHAVGSGWEQFSAVFSPRDGIIYAVAADGTLRWYHHTGWRDGQATWTGPHDVGRGWSSVRAPFALLPGLAPVIH